MNTDKDKFKEIKESFDKLDLSKVPEYNLPDYSEDSLTVLEAKLLVIQSKQKMKESK